jgi:hypothetical protein
VVAAIDVWLGASIGPVCVGGKRDTEEDFKICKEIFEECLVLSLPVLLVHSEDDLSNLASFRNSYLILRI